MVLVASGRPATIGRYPPWTLAAARAEAKKRLAQKTLGKITPTRTVFDDARADFLKDCEKRNKPLHGKRLPAAPHEALSIRSAIGR